MKKYNVWIRGPYAEWEKATAESVDLKSAEQIADIHRSSGAELRVKVVPANQKPALGNGAHG